MELLKLEPTAWKNTGNVSEDTSGMKLIPMIRNAFIPMSITS